MKIFFLTPRVPFPIDKGDKLRAFYQIKYLSQRHEIFLFAIDENSSNHESYGILKDYCKSVKVVQLSKWKILTNLLSGIFRIIPFQTSYYFSQKVKKEIEQAISEINPDVIFCQLIRSAEFLKDIKDIPKVIDYVDVISKGLERRISASNIFWKILLKQEYKRAFKYEETVFKNFDKSIIITQEDRTNLSFSNKESVNILPNGIDTVYFKPIESQKKYDIFFSGNLSYPPNVNAAEYIAKNLLPLLLIKKPDIKILIAGASPVPRVKSLQSNNITVKGWTYDIRDYYKEAKIFIAPMQIGTGLQNKLLQAMAMQMPCVVSELTRKGLCNGDKDVVLVAKTDNDYIDMVVKLLEDEKYANSVGMLGYEYVKEKYEWNKIISDLESIFYSVVKSS